MPLGHLGINVPDLTAAKAYYDALMPLLGYEPLFAEADQFAYLPAGGKRGTYLFVYPAVSPGTGYDAGAPGLQHLAFTLPTRADVDAVHAHVVATGGDVLHPPQAWPQYPPPYWATFWRDPHGFVLEAVCHHDR